MQNRKDLRVGELEANTLATDAAECCRRQFEVHGHDLIFRAWDRFRVAGDGAVPACSEKRHVLRGLRRVFQPCEQGRQSAR